MCGLREKLRQEWPFSAPYEEASAQEQIGIALQTPGVSTEKFTTDFNTDKIILKQSSEPLSQLIVLFFILSLKDDISLCLLILIATSAVRASLLNIIAQGVSHFAWLTFWGYVENLKTIFNPLGWIWRSIWFKFVHFNANRKNSSQINKIWFLRLCK